MNDGTGVGISKTKTQISGNVKLNLKKDIKLKALLVTLKGKVKTKFQEENTLSGPIGPSSPCLAKELIFERTRMLYPFNGRDSALAESTIATGYHEYTFALALPSNIPPSFRGSYGKIEYTVCANINKAPNTNARCKVRITVGGGANLNLIPRMRQQVQTSNSMQIAPRFAALLGHTKGVVEATATINQSGFCSGEDVGLRVLVRNQSSDDIRSVSAEIVTRAIYFGRKQKDVGKLKMEITKVNNVSVDRMIKPKAEDTVKMPNFLIPEKTTPSFYSSLIYHEYFVNVVVETSGAESDLEIGIPITIGGTRFIGGISSSRRYPSPLVGLQVIKPVDVKLMPILPTNHDYYLHPGTSSNKANNATIWPSLGALLENLMNGKMKFEK